LRIEVEMSTKGSPEQGVVRAWAQVEAWSEPQVVDFSKDGDWLTVDLGGVQLRKGDRLRIDLSSLPRAQPRTPDQPAPTHPRPVGDVRFGGWGQRNSNEEYQVRTEDNPDWHALDHEQPYPQNVLATRTIKRAVGGGDPETIVVGSPTCLPGTGVYVYKAWPVAKNILLNECVAVGWEGPRNPDGKHTPRLRATRS
jgi:hypothetical protein